MRQSEKNKESYWPILGLPMVVMGLGFFFFANIAFYKAWQTNDYAPQQVVVSDRKIVSEPDRAYIKVTAKTEDGKSISIKRHPQEFSFSINLGVPSWSQVFRGRVNEVGDSVTVYSSPDQTEHYLSVGPDYKLFLIHLAIGIVIVVVGVRCLR